MSFVLVQIRLVRLKRKKKKLARFETASFFIAFDLTVKKKDDKDTSPLLVFAYK